MSNLSGLAVDAVKEVGFCLWQATGQMLSQYEGLVRLLIRRFFLLCRACYGLVKSNILYYFSDATCIVLVLLLAL